MFEPLVKTIEVPCSQEKAFDIFVNEMDSWWPMGQFTTSAMGGSPAKAIRVEPKVGGQIVEISPDDSEHLWGTFKVYDPFDFISMDFHIVPPGEEIDAWTLVDVKFTALEADRTQVELKQTNWEAYGEEKAKMLRGGYGTGWGMIFEQGYKSACESQAVAS